MKIFKGIVAVALLAAVCGCSVQGKGVDIYFFNKDGKMMPVNRDLPTLENPELIAMDQLLRGPNDAENLAGFSTAVPSGTRAIDVNVEGSVAIIDLNEGIAQLKGEAATKKALAQIIYTATGVKGVKKVLLKLEGSDNFGLNGNKVVIDHPLDRSDVKI